MRKTIRALAAAALLSMTLSGCGGFRLVFNPEELYTLPELPAKYTELNAQLNAILEDGAEYAAPTSGSNIQPVQLTDLDGDGAQEAVAFFRKAEDEKPLKIYIFSAEGDRYQQSAVIEGSGASVYSVVYSDLDGDGLQELVVLHADEEGEGVADYYDWQQDGTLLNVSSTRLSVTMAEVNQGRVISGTLLDGLPAVFVTGVTTPASSELTAAAVTDILVAPERELSNAALSSTTGITGVIAPYCGLYPMDITGDGLTEVPVPYPSSGEEGLALRWVDWRRYGLDNEAETVVTTYHSIEDGWYLQVPEDWIGRVGVDRSSAGGESTVSFCQLNADGSHGGTVLRISALTGSDREVRAARGNRFSLSRQSTSIYTAELPETPSWEYAMTAEEVRTAFSLIAREWIPADN